MADAKAHAPIVWGAMGVERFQAIVPRVTAAFLDAEFPGGKLQLVMKNDHLLGRNLIEAQNGADAIAGQVHISAGLDQQAFYEPKPAFRHLALKLAGAEGGEIIPPGNFVHGEKTDIVTVAGVLAPRIAETDDDPRGRHALAPQQLGVAACCRNDGRDGEIAVAADNLRPRRNGELRDVHRAVDIDVQQIDRQMIRNVVGIHFQFDRVLNDVQQAALFNADRLFLIDEMHGDIDRNGRNPRRRAGNPHVPDGR